MSGNDELNKLDDKKGVPYQPPKVMQLNIGFGDAECNPSGSGATGNCWSGLTPGGDCENGPSATIFGCWDGDSADPSTCTSGLTGR